jgi:3-deoxy-D-manno-octulosonate 8-phosphate phosphatase (KDO 8-P phosphatase)
MSPEKIRLVLLDVDGVLTDGTLWFSKDGEVVKQFHARDGLGIVMLQKRGIKMGVITGRSSPPLTKRLQDLNITIVAENVQDKLAAYREILAKEQVTKEEVAYMGDDLPDIPVFQEAGLSAAPADAVPEVKKIVQFVSPYPGGRGAVRSLADLILSAQKQGRVSV